jgi:sugar phosphate isomerase/epimerase
MLPGLSAATSGPVYDAQLASIRPSLRKNADQILHDVAAMGFKAVEGYARVDTLALAPRLKQAGLAIRSTACETPLVTADWENYPEFKRIALTEAIDSLKSLGAEYFIMGDISSGARGDGDDFYRRTADRMNAVGQACRRAGLKFLWQTQGFHFQGKPGLRPIDIFHDRLDPKFTSMELDAFRVSLAGHDPTEMLKQWRGRVNVVRLVDKTKGTRGQFEDAVEQGAFSNLGEGALDFPAIIRAAASAGVRTFTVGQAPLGEDEATGLRRNLEYLKNLHA